MNDEKYGKNLVKEGKREKKWITGGGKKGREQMGTESDKRGNKEQE